ncbi:MAG: hypothetical protein ACREV1_08775 [Gammaproteobacteria bacterium]
MRALPTAGPNVRVHAVGEAQAVSVLVCALRTGHPEERIKDRDFSVSSVCHAHEQTPVNRAHSARYPYYPFPDASRPPSPTVLRRLT